MRLPPFEWPTTGDRVGRHRVEHRHRVPQVGLPVVERGVLGVAVAAVVPRHDAEPGVGQDRREHVEGAGEVHAAVGEEDRRRAPRRPTRSTAMARPWLSTVRCRSGRRAPRIRDRSLIGSPDRGSDVPQPDPATPVTDVIWTSGPSPC